jgi:hypothetical protein
MTSAEMARVARALLLLAMAAVVLGGCGGDAGGPAKTATTAAKAACTKPALLRELGGAGAAITKLRCAPGYAFTEGRDGETRGVVLWHDVQGRWIAVARDEPGACPAEAVAQSLCTAPPLDPALRRCSDEAFRHALAEDVDKLRHVIDERRCSGGFATTRFTIDDCRPEQAKNRSACERTRIAAWRRGPARWLLITYRPQLDCGEVRAVAPKFPETLCG